MTGEGATFVFCYSRRYHPAIQRYVPQYFVGVEEDGCETWTAIDCRTQEWVTLRCLNAKKGSQHIENDIYVWRTFHNPHIVRFREVMSIRDWVITVADKAPGDSLFHFVDQIGPLSEADARHYFQQQVIVLDFVQRRGKSGFSFKLNDFVLSADRKIAMLNRMSHSQNPRGYFSPYFRMRAIQYASPEKLREIPGRSLMSDDVWQIGVCLYYMLYMTFPFASTEDVVNDCREESVIHRNANVPLSTGVIDLLTRLLEKDPAKRITVPEVLRHPWFLQELPAGALSTNEGVDPIDDMLISTLDDVQSMEEIENVLWSARSHALLLTQ